MNVKGIVCIMAVGMVIFLSCGITNLSASDDSSEILLLFSTWQKALKFNEAEKLWELAGKVVRRYNNNDYNLFKETIRKYLTDSSQDGFILAQPDEVVMITPDRAWIKFTTTSEEYFKGFYVVKEDGKWETAFLRTYYALIIRDLNHLNQAIKKYYTKENQLPTSLLKLVPGYINILPQDPFSDEGKTYNYEILEKNQKWRLYSIGIDSIDDHGQNKYENTTGDYGQGDIIMVGSII